MASKLLKSANNQTAALVVVAFVCIDGLANIEKRNDGFRELPKGGNKYKSGRIV